MFFERSEEAIRAADRKYGKLCYKIAHNILNSSGDAEECVNDAYLGAWNTIPPARPEPLGAYLCKIVRNLALNRYHAGCALKRGGGNCAVALEELEECLASGSSVEDSLAGQELVRLIEAFWMGCPWRIGSFFWDGIGLRRVIAILRRGLACRRKPCRCGWCVCEKDCAAT